MKLPGIDYGRPVQSLGRESPTGPVRVAQARAAVAEKRADVASSVARNTAAIGSINAQVSGQLLKSQYAMQARTNQFANDVARLTGAGMKLTADIVKADVTRDLSEYKRKQRELMEGMAGENAVRTTQILRDPSDPSQGTKTISLATELPTAFKKELTKLNEQTIKNSNWMARGMMEEQVANLSADAEFEIQKMANAWQKDFSAGQALESINEAVLNQDWKTARELHTSFRGLFSGAKNAQIAKTLDAAQRTSDIDNLSFDTAHNIMQENKGYVDRMGAAEKIKNKEVRQGAIKIIQRQEDTRKYAETQAKQWRKDQVDSHLLNQMKNLPPDQWTHSEYETAAEYEAVENLKQKHIAGYNAQTNPATYYELSMMSPEQLSNTNLLEHVDNLSQTDYKAFVSMQADIRNGTLPKAITHKQLTDVTMKRAFAGIGLENYHKDEPEKYAAMFELVQREMYDYEQETGKKMTDVEQAQLINRVMQPYTKPDTFLLVPVNKDVSIAKDIDPKLLNPLADYLRGIDKDVTAEELGQARDQFNEYRQDYETFYKNSGIKDYSEDDLVDMFEEDTFIRQIIASENREVTAKNRKSYYLNYKQQVPLIDQALVSRGTPVTTANRMKLWKALRDKRQ